MAFSQCFTFLSNFTMIFMKLSSKWFYWRYEVFFNKRGQNGRRVDQWNPSVGGTTSDTLLNTVLTGMIYVITSICYIFCSNFNSLWVVYNAVLENECVLCTELTIFWDKCRLLSRLAEHVGQHFRVFFFGSSFIWGLWPRRQHTIGNRDITWTIVNIWFITGSNYFPLCFLCWATAITQTNTNQLQVSA